MQISQNIELLIFIAKLGFLSSLQDLTSTAFLLHHITCSSRADTWSENSLTTVCSSIFLERCYYRFTRNGSFLTGQSGFSQYIIMGTKQKKNENGKMRVGVEMQKSRLEERI